MTATKYLDLAGLRYLKTKMDAKYVTSSDISTAITNAFATYKQNIVTIVSSLPSTGEEGLLYLVPDSNASSDVYTTWAWENRWVQMGSATFSPATVDSTVIEDSTNAVSGGAVYSELALKLNASELTSSIAEDGTNAVTSGAIYDALALKLNASELTSSIAEDGTNAVTSGAIYDALALKLGSADVDSTVIEDSANPVSGGAIYDALALKLDSADVASIEDSDIDALFV